MPIEIKRLTRDILNIIGYGGFYNTDILNQKLERLGWRKNIVNNYIIDEVEKTLLLRWYFIILNTKEHIKLKFVLKTLSVNVRNVETEKQHLIEVLDKCKWNKKKPLRF